MRLSLVVVLIGVSGLSAGTAQAQMGPPRGGPPPEAFTACEGKAAGDACSHPTPFGQMNGNCRQMRDRLQCMPGGGGTGGGGPGGAGPGGGGGPGRSGGFGIGSPALDQGGSETGGPPSPRVTFDSLPVPFQRMAAQSFTLPDGRTHWYQAILLPQGGVNWPQAKSLAEQVGGYLATIHSKAENDFVFSLIQDRKFWFEWDGSHNHVMNGPFLGGFQPQGSSEPRGGWRWVTSEPWDYENWAWDGMPGDRDPRPNTQPNDATGNQNVLAFGEVNEPVPTWGDFPQKFSSYNDSHEGKCRGFVIEYDRDPGR